MSDRIRLLREGIEPATQKGLEIGALNAPTVLPQEGDVRFVDRADDATLRDSHPLRLEGLVNVDYIWPGTGSLAAVIGTGELFDWAIASHVIEHVPNMLGWLRGIAEVLKPGGILNLAIPDCRFTFDVDSPRSTIGQVIESDFWAIGTRAFAKCSITAFTPRPSSLPPFGAARSMSLRCHPSPATMRLRLHMRMP